MHVKKDMLDLHTYNGFKSSTSQLPSVYAICQSTEHDQIQNNSDAPRSGFNRHCKCISASFNSKFTKFVKMSYHTNDASNTHDRAC